MNEEIALERQLASHLNQIHAAAQDNEFVDLNEARRLHDLLVGMLNNWNDLEPTQRALVSDAIRYFVQTNDEEDDLRSPVGFEDDTEVVEAVLRRISLHDRR